MTELMNRLKSRALRAIRSGRPVAWVPEFMRLGNLLYMGHWAYEGEGRRVLLHDCRRASLDLFPRLRRELFLSPAEARWTDQRLQPWKSEERDPKSGYNKSTLNSFILDMLIPESRAAVENPHFDSDILVVNVRRGDYFGTIHQAEFGINTKAYTLAAIAGAIESGGVPSAITVVSDDLEWCRDALSRELQGIAPTDFRQGGPAEDLACLIHAPRLILPNSTFSYWGGYIGDVLNPGRQVVAPWFFGRGMSGGAAHQLRPHWQVIHEIPGGWDAVGP